MEKHWAVEVWGEIIGNTEIFFTKREALVYFKSLRKQLDSNRYIITKDTIMDKYDSNNAIYLVDLGDL